MSVRAYFNSTTAHPTWDIRTEHTYLEFVIPSTPNTYCYECTTPGVSGIIEPTWPTTPGQTVIDGEQVFNEQTQQYEYVDPITWTCRNLLAPNPLQVVLDTEGFGGYPLKDIWVNSQREVGNDEFSIYGSYDGENWRYLGKVSDLDGCQVGLFAIYNGNPVNIIHFQTEIVGGVLQFLIGYYDANGSLGYNLDPSKFIIVAANHKSLQNSYRYIKVCVDSEHECEIEIVASAN